MKIIALVDDDENILTSVSMVLEAEGFTVRLYKNGADALNGLMARPADLVILDIKMPRMDGMEMLTQLRRHSDMPVIFLTSRDDEEDEVEGLQKGADDYIKKPFSHRLLIERIRALLRRDELNSQEKSGQKRSRELIARGPLVLDSACHICSWEGTAIPLTITEFLIVKALAQRPGYVKNRDQLMTEAYGEYVDVDDRTIDSHIKRLRKKFRAVDPDFDRVETLYGVGYRYKLDA